MTYVTLIGLVRALSITIIAFLLLTPCFEGADAELLMPSKATVSSDFIIPFWKVAAICGFQATLYGDLRR